MTKSRKIDEIYRERLNNVETTPPADIWQNINGRLPEKKKKRILPIWYAFAGTAAAIALFFLLFNYNYFNDPQTTDATLATTSNNRFFNFDPTSTSFEETMKRSSNILKAAVLETRLEILKAEIKANKTEGNRQLLNASGRSTNRLAENQDQKTIKSSDPGKEAQISSATPLLKKDLKILEKPLIKQGEILAGTEPKEDPDITEKTSEEAVAALEKSSEVAVEGVEKNSEEAIAEAKIPEKPLQQNGFKEEDTEKSSISTRFSITPTAAAVYFDNFGNGNILDGQFDNRESSGEISMSYGVNLAYEFTEKLKIRSGISKVDLVYNTSDVNVVSILNSQAVKLNSNLSGEIMDHEENNGVSPSGFINQRLGFIEVPIELEYTIIDRKIGFHLIGGLSTLFLKDNGLELELENFNADVGKANNVNRMSFSANFGVGIDYYLAPRFQINLEPILKYQINTFNTTSKLHSYYFGIYSGLSFKF